MQVSVTGIHHTRGSQIFQKPRSHPKILSARRVTKSKFHTEYSQILGAHNLASQLTWCLGICAPLLVFESYPVLILARSPQI